MRVGIRGTTVLDNGGLEEGDGPPSLFYSENLLFDR